MRLLIQRVKNSSVSVNGKKISEIGRGLLVFVGIGKEDNEKDLKKLSDKLIKLRIFEDENGKMNLNVNQAKGSILSVPQFTLYADTRKGNRPGFEFSADPKKAKGDWEKFNGFVEEGGVVPKKGVFGEHMEVNLINDGPVTIWLDSKEV
ncbi:MAG: D-tyrosyl-tRNA(Tyr) deacylase [Candidatus Omnitrophica bacterium]|nr:D-tyrosyl-tRNA(Tyr) deacylase [Candidatus Omnitrophota bacterium]